jgi:hypothetical protein
MFNQTAIPDLTTDQLLELQSQIQCSLGSQVRHLRLVVREGRFVLQGRARTYYCKQLAQKLAADVTGKGNFVNDIRVE